MKIHFKKAQERLRFFSSLYESAKCAYSNELEKFLQNINQYRGERELDGSAVKASTVRNITYEIVESQISSLIPSPKADAPSFSDKKGRLSQTIERLCRAVKERLPFDRMNDLDERYTYIFGGSVWLVQWNNDIRRGTQIGDVEVNLISPREFIPEPYVYEIEDMEYCFLELSTTRGALVRKWPLSAELSSELELLSEGEDAATDTVRLIIAFYKNENGDISQFIFSGDAVLEDRDGYYRRAVPICEGCGERQELCQCSNPKIILKNEQFEMLNDPCGIDAPKKVDYYLPKRFPIVIRKNTSSENRLLGQSDCEYVRPEQQAINKIESRILQKLLRSGVTPVVPEDANIAMNNAVFGDVIKMKPGESMAQYGKVDTTPDISQDIAEAQRLYDNAKRTLGISDAYQGLAFDKNESGYARQLRIAQASGRLESKKKMKQAAYRDLYRIIFEHYLAFADEPRELSYRDSLGIVHNEHFNRYDFLEYDTSRAEYYYDDDYLFSVDPDGGAEFERETLWERNLENLRSGTLGNPTSSATLLRYWQCQEQSHYPGARENVEYFQEIVRKEEIQLGQEQYRGAIEEKF